MTRFTGRIRLGQVRFPLSAWPLSGPMGNLDSRLDADRLMSRLWAASDRGDGSMGDHGPGGYEQHIRLAESARRAVDVLARQINGAALGIGER